MTSLSYFSGVAHYSKIIENTEEHAIFEEVSTLTFHSCKMMSMCVSAQCHFCIKQVRYIFCYQ